MLLAFQPRIQPVNIAPGARTPLAAWLPPVLVFVAAVVAGINAIDASPVGVFYDDAHYVILARSLATGEGYRYLNLPGAPVATHFPPGYPAFLALLWGISSDFPANAQLFKMVNAILLGVVAVASYGVARRVASVGPALATLIAASATITIPPLVLSSSVMSEVFFLALLLPLLPVAERWVEREGLGHAVMLGAAAGLLFLVRSHGVVLVVAFAFGYAFRQRYREAIVAVAVSLIVMMPWLLFVRHYDPLIPEPLRGQYGSYGSWLADGLRRGGVGILFAALRDNLITTYAIIARSFSIAQNPLFDAITVVSVLALLVAGIIALVSRARVTLLFLAGYFGTVLVWPFSPLRFIWGVWPLLMLILVSGAALLWRSGPSTQPAKIGRRFGLAASVVVLAGGLLFTVRGYANAWWATVSVSTANRIQPQLNWTNQYARADAVVAADDEGAVYLYTGRRAVPANAFTVEQYFRARPTPENAARMRDILRVTSADYVVAWAQPTQDAAALLAAMIPPVLVQVDTIPTGRVYRTVR